MYLALGDAFTASLTSFLNQLVIRILRRFDLILLDAPSSLTLFGTGI